MFRNSGTTSNNMYSISDNQRCISWAMYQSQFSEWVLVRMSPPIFLKGYMSATRKWQIHRTTKSIILDRFSSKMTGLLVLTIWRRHSHILPCKAGMILTCQKLSTNYPLLINIEMLAEPTFYASSIVRMIDFSALGHHRYFISDKPMCVECAEVSNQPHSAMHQKILEFPTLASYSVHKLSRTGNTKLLDWYSDTIRMYSFAVYSLNFRMGCRTTIHHFTVQHLFRVWDLIAR